MKGVKELNTNTLRCVDLSFQVIGLRNSKPSIQFKQKTHIWLKFTCSASLRSLESWDAAVGARGKA